jgi:hypothetical protein
MPTTEIAVDTYRFRIIDNTDINNGRIHSRNFKIGGNYPDCVNVSIRYKDNQPSYAKIQTLVSDPECSLTKPLDKGEGSILMIKTLLRHINTEIPEITQFTFDDYSKLECGTEDEKYQKRRRARGTHAVPVPLYYFSIAFNGITWYEKHFNAIYKDPESHTAYREQIEHTFTGPKMSFEDFIHQSGISSSIIENEIQPYYESASNYRDFFTSIPRDKRCPLVRGWINSFMLRILHNIFYHDEWIIDSTKMDANRGGRNNSKENKDKRKTRKGNKRNNKTHKDTYYCPKGSYYYSDTRGEMSVEDY